MTWIKTVSPKDSAPLREAMQKQAGLYPKEYKIPVDGLGGESILFSHSLLPDTLYHSFSAFGTLMSPDLPLSRTQHEMIATTVSQINDCFY